MPPTVSELLNFRVRRADLSRLRAAADAANETLTALVLTASDHRAAELLDTHTVVPTDYYDA